MAATRSLLRRESTEEAGFTIIEVVIAAAILAIAILLTVGPLVTSMRALDRSKDVTIAESIAQGRIEQVRALEFSDIGHPGSAPDGVLARSETQSVEGASFLIETTVEFVGAASGLDIVPQGGDGVEGIYDVGVNYKHVHVVVTAVGSGADPVTMDTFIAPPTVGGLEDIAVIEVTLNRHEPFDPSLDPEPVVRISGPWIYDSAAAEAKQYFADVFVGTYTISLVTSHGWTIHPDSVDSGATSVTAVLGTGAQRTLRVYQPVSLDVVVLDDDTGLPLTSAVLAATDLAYGPAITNAAGDYSFSGLVPDRYRIDAVAGGYQSESVEVDVPGTGGGSSATATIRMSPQTFVGVDYDFFVDHDGASDYHINGATVRVTHPTYGVFVGTTDETGHTVIELPASTSGFSVTASTPWGHDPATAALTTGSSPGSGTFSLAPPPITDVFSLRNGAAGPAGFFEYKVGSGPWVRLLANDVGRATFVVPEDDGTIVEMRTYCSTADHPASPDKTRSEPLDGRDFSLEHEGIMLNRLLRDESGVTLTELMVAGAMAAIISAAFLLVFSSFNRSVSLEEARATALREVQAAAADLSAELRQAIPLTDGSFAVVALEAGWPAPELVFYSDRARDAAGPERYRYYVGGCSGNICDLIREVTVADAGGPPWTFTGTAYSERVVANVLSDGDPLFRGADWKTGSEVLTTSCGTSVACEFSLVQIVVRIDPDPDISAEEALHVRHEVRLRNAP